MDDLSEIYRIIDANANRAREALRVAEEAARFAMERPDLAEALKRLRHDLRAAMERLDAQALLLARDTAGDVGTAISTAAERTRAGTADVARAAFKRLTEALRAIEEYGKALDAEMAAAVERIRYRAYDLEKRFEEASRPKVRLAAGGVCVLLTESLCRRPWLEVLRAVLAGGAAAVQVREKGMPDGQLLARARETSRAAHEAGAIAIVNDRPDIAVLAAADGVHVGQGDMAPNEARRIVGPDRIVGVSTHSLAQALAAAEAGADYIGCGPMFQSTTKPQEVIPGPALATEVVRQVGLPVMAIGGITAANAPQVLAAGVRWLAVSGVVCSAANPEAETRRMVISI
ncbi:MAG: thiamine phosphate synthase [Planctomycetota bacterium]|nr:thiamine phosphate synthase [Planctomycetota bacterium]